MVSTIRQAQAESLPVLGPFTVENNSISHIAAYTNSRTGSDPLRTYSLQVNTPPRHGHASTTSFRHTFPPYVEKIVSYRSNSDYSGEDRFVYSVIETVYSYSQGTRTSSTNTFEVHLLILPPPPEPISPRHVLVDSNTTLFSFPNDQYGFEKLSIVSLSLKDTPRHGIIEFTNESNASRPAMRQLTYQPTIGYVGYDQFVLNVELLTRNLTSGAYVATTNCYLVNLRVGFPLTADHPIIAPDGSYLIVFQGAIPGLTYQIQNSTNLMDWVVLTNLIARDSSLEYRNQGVTDRQRQYYRCAEVP